MSSKKFFNHPLFEIRTTPILLSNKFDNFTLKHKLTKQPLFILCISFILGIISQELLLLTEKQIYSLLLFSLLTFLLPFFRFHKVYKYKYFSLIFFFFSLGIFAHSQKTKKVFLPQLKKNELIVFKITTKLNSNEKNRRYEVLAKAGKESFRSILSYPKSEVELDFLHYYKASAYINRVPKADRDFQFDYARYLSRKDIYFQSYLPNGFTSAPRNDLSFSEKIRQKRLETLNKIDRSKLSKKTREFTKGIILADRTEMDKETVMDFSKSGLMHILAISGSHMAVIFLLILLVLKPVFSAKYKKLKIIVALLLIWAFAIFIDYGSSVVRSCIMISCYYIYVLTQRKSDLLHSMAIAAFIILIADSNQFYDVGFQLSFSAVFGIFWLNSPILKYLPKPRNNFQDLLVNIVSISFAAQIATLPLVIYYFHQWSFISIPANLVVIPFSEILIVFSLLMTLLIAFSIQFSWLNLVYDFCVTKTLGLIHFFADVESFFHTMIPMTLLEVFVCFAIIYFLRFAIVSFNIQNVLKVMFFILNFVALRMLLNYRANQMNEVLVHRYFKEKIISVKNKDKVIFLVPEKSKMDKIQTYIIEPYLTSRRTKNYEARMIPDEMTEIKINDKIYYLK